MPLTSSGRKHGSGGDHSDSSTAQKSLQQRSKIRVPDDSDYKPLSQAKRIKDAEISVPIVYGTQALWLGKKATEYMSHKWSVYVRGATNEDLGVVVKRAVFQLHPSFNNPTRVVDSPPFVLSESGWGEFEIVISLYFHNDVCDKPLDLYHYLKLYPEDESAHQSTKKPVVVETYDEIVFPEPSEAFFGRVQNHPAVNVPRMPAGFSIPSAGPVEDTSSERGDTKDHPLSQWFINFSEADELSKLAVARQQALQWVTMQLIVVGISLVFARWMTVQMAGQKHIEQDGLTLQGSLLTPSSNGPCHCTEVLYVDDLETCLMQA